MHAWLCFLSVLLAVSNRKAPPPVPPRTTSKPLISVTLQSSTESAQDTYLDQQDRGSEANSQSGRSTSSDSLCSILTGSLVKGTYPSATVTTTISAPAAGPAVPPVPAPRDLHSTVTTSTSTQSQNDTLTPIITLEEPPTAQKRKLSSIGIQVNNSLQISWASNLPNTNLPLWPSFRWIVLFQSLEKNHYHLLHL